MGVHTYTRVVDCSLRTTTILLVLLLLPGCAALTMGASVISSVIDRYEKHQIEKRLEELEKPLDKEAE